MITKLLEVRGKKPGKNVQLSEDDIKHLCTKSRELFISQPNLLELEAPIKICGKYFLSSELLKHISITYTAVRGRNTTDFQQSWHYQKIKLTQFTNVYCLLIIGDVHG